MGYIKSMAQDHPFLGTAVAVEILPVDSKRTYICFYSVFGNCEITIGDGDFDTCRKVLPEGVMWEPNLAFGRNIWFRGDGAKLVVTY